MTLTITVATPSCIYQSADYRLTDFLTGNTRDFETQKVFLVNTSSWSASICFAGVGRTPNVDVSDWLERVVQRISRTDSIDVLFDALATADDWLAALSPKNRRHSFSVGAFVGSRPVVALISNFEKLSGERRPVSDPRLTLEHCEPTRPVTFVSGDRDALTEHARRSLRKVAERNPTVDGMFAALASTNRGAARNSKYVSPACFTAYLHNTGDGGGRPQDTGNARLRSALPVSPAAEDVVKALLDQKFGPGQWTQRQVAFGRQEPTDDFHRTQLREKPNDPQSHSNFGAYLQNVKNDLSGAEQAYRRALELDPAFANAQVNLANVVSERGEFDEAEALYRSATAIGDENGTWNYAQFLRAVRNDLAGAIDTLRKGIAANPNSSRLCVRLALFLILAKQHQEALGALVTARERQGDQAEIEALHAQALQLSGAETRDCIAAYRTAIALNPQEAGLQLNLSQLLFRCGETEEAGRLLRAAMRGTVDASARLECQFYRLCYCGNSPSDVAQATRTILAEGGRLDWNVEPDIELARLLAPRLASLAVQFEYWMRTGDDSRISRALREYGTP